MELKKIKLHRSRDKFAIVDDRDYVELLEYRWCLSPYGYAVADVKNGKKWETIYMHRLILGISKGLDTDHINHDRLDNRRKNIRACNRTQNSMNRSMMSNNTSGYKGVHFHEDLKKWRVIIQVNGCRKHIGLFINKLDAARAYNKAAQKYFGEFACINEIPN